VFPNNAMRRFRTVFLALSAIAAAVVVWRAMPSPAAAEKPPAKTAAASFMPTQEQLAGFRIEPVRTLSFRDLLHTDGAIAFDDDALTPVLSPYSGRVSRVIAKLGDSVRKGQPLLTVAATEFVQGQSDLAAAQATLTTAQAAEARQHALYDAGAGALKDWRQAQADLATARAGYNAVRGRLRILGRSDAQIDALEAGTGGSGEATVTAPINGTVTQRQVGPGQVIVGAAAGGNNPVFTIADLATVWLLANVREGDAPAVRLGQPAEVTVLALPGRTFTGRVAWVGAALDPVTHRLPVRIEVPNRDGALKPMMFASFTIATSEATTAPAVPESALVYDGEVARVFAVGVDGSIAGREVRVGRRQGGMIEILDGLHAGERIVTAGALFVDRAASGE
jgi:cobalt-zinc-cadmium efflux system membrane fusion protein